MKDIIVVVSLLVAVGLAVVTVRVAQKADKATRSLEEERYSRMVAEETLQKNGAKLMTLQDQLKETRDRMAKITDVLEQEKGVNGDLKKQYDQLIEAKANLEDKLHTALQEKAVDEAALKTQGQTPTVPATASPGGAH